MKKEYLYILECEDKIKIGVSKNVDKRIKQLQTGNPNEITLYHYEERDDAYKIESKLHKMFKNKNKQGEWFCGLEAKDVKKELLKLIL